VCPSSVDNLLIPYTAQHYKVPPDVENPELDCYTHMENWLVHLQSLLGRPLTDDDFIFPAIASTGHIKFGEPTSRSGFESLLDMVVDQSGVLQGRNGRFTTHCFRRGGAQYRFMWAKRRWSLKAVKWWGGWSSSENVSHLDTKHTHLLNSDMSRSVLLCDICWMNS
jgi:hypothetical protein